MASTPHQESGTMLFVGIVVGAVVVAVFGWILFIKFMSDFFKM